MNENPLKSAPLGVFRHTLVVIDLLVEGNWAERCKGGNGVFVNHLLLAFAVHDNGEIIEGLDYAADLEPVGEIYRYRDVFFAELV
jgi:hypothetical protein